MRIRHVRILHVLPVIVMLGVAVFNLHLVYGSGLSIWRVGGFGMFSSLDNRATRYVKAVAITDKATIALDLSGYKSTVDHLRILPRDHDLQRFLEELACTQELLPAKAAAVELTYYGLELKGNKAIPVVRWRESRNGCSTP